MSIPQGVKYIIISTVFFALMNVGVKYLPHIPAYEIVFFRALISLLVCYILIRRENLKLWGNNKRVLILRGAAGTVALLLYFYTLQRMPLASAVTIQYLSPIFTIILATFIMKEKPRAAQWLFFLVSFSGVLLIKGFDPRVTVPEMLIGVISAVFSGLAYNFIRKLRNTDHALVVVFYFPLVTVPFVGGYTIFHWVTPSVIDWVIIAGIGLATTIAQVFMTHAYQLERASNVTNYNYLGSVYAIVLGFILFNESVTWLALAGIALIVFGVIMSARYRAE